MNRIKFRFYRGIFVFIVACYGLSSCILWGGAPESPLPFPQTATFEAAREAAWHQFLTKEAGNRHGTLPPSEQTPPWQRPTPSPGPLRFPTPEGTPAGAGRILPYIPQPPVKDMVSGERMVGMVRGRTGANGRPGRSAPRPGRRAHCAGGAGGLGLGKHTGGHSTTRGAALPGPNSSRTFANPDRRGRTLDPGHAVRHRVLFRRTNTSLRPLLSDPQPSALTHPVVQAGQGFPVFRRRDGHRGRGSVPHRWVPEDPRRARGSCEWGEFLL
jgi:hypothetical protein